MNDIMRMTEKEKLLKHSKVWDEFNAKNKLNEMKTEEDLIMKNINMENSKEQILQREFDKENLDNTTQVQFCYNAINRAMEQYTKEIKFKLQQIALADDEMVNKEGAAIKYREIVRELLKTF